MGVIEDNGRLRSAALLQRLNEVAQSGLAGDWREDAADLDAHTPTPVALCLLVGIVASQQEQIAELREQLRRMR